MQLGGTHTVHLDELPNRAEWEARLRALESLAIHEGWAIYAQVQRNEAERLQVEAVKTDNPTVMAKNLGASQAVRSMLSWLQREILTLRQQLR